MHGSAPLTVRPACRHDIPTVAARIGASEDEVVRRLRNRHATCFVADGADNNIAHIIFEWRADHLFILGLAADEPSEESIDALLAAVWAGRGAREWVDIVVPEDRLDLQLSLRRNCFRAIHVLPKWFGDDGLDGYQMERREDDE